jgi:glycerol-3-phosphate acyltransferase PlsY
MIKLVAIIVVVSYLLGSIPFGYLGRPSTSEAGIIIG